jgi:purine catabolism regulator
LSITVVEALKFNSLRNVQVIAGQNGLLRTIRYVNVMEVPDIINWVSGDELLLTTGYPFKDNLNKLVDLITSLSDKSLAGLAIKLHRFFDTIPEEAIAKANELNFPILELPPDARFDEIICEIMTEVVNRNYNVIKRTEEIHQVITHLVLSGGEFQEIAQSLADICLAHVIICGESEEMLADALPAKTNALEATQKEISNCIKNDYIERPVQLHHKIIATIKLKTLDRQVENEDIVAVERAATITALVFLKKHAAAEVEKKFRNDFLDDLVNGEIETKDTVLQRGRFFGMDLSLPYLLYIIDIDSFKEVFLSKLQHDEKKSHTLILKLLNFVNKTFLLKAEKSIIWGRSDSVIVLYPFTGDDGSSKEDIKQLSTSIAEQIKQVINKNIKEFTVSIGIGSFCPDIMEIQNSYREALTAIRVGKAVWGKDGVYHYDNIGVYRLLYQFPDRMELLKYADTVVGKIIKYDRDKGTKLIQTLENYLNNNYNQKVAAEKMFIHPKTLSYRLRKIEEILGLSLSSAENCFSLYIALKILSLSNNNR